MAVRRVRHCRTLHFTGVCIYLRAQPVDAVLAPVNSQSELEVVPCFDGVCRRIAVVGIDGADRLRSAAKLLGIADERYFRMRAQDKHDNYRY